MRLCTYDICNAIYYMKTNNLHPALLTCKSVYMISKFLHAYTFENIFN